MIYHFIVTEEEEGQRIDLFLTRKGELSLSRAQIKRIAAEGKVSLNGQPVKVSHKVRTGDEVTVEKPPPQPMEILPEEIPLSIVYEDSHLLVVDKPAGMVVHPAAGNFRGTLVNALLFHVPDLAGIGGVLRPGIVHRLDKGTSGLMVVAKTERAHQELAAQFKRHLVKKVYQAVVYGDVKDDQGMIDVPVGRDIAQRKKISTRTRRGKEARTFWEVLERFKYATHLLVMTETGRTHQIRAHFTHLNHPLIGDVLYGSQRRFKTLPEGDLKEGVRKMSRPALHACELGFFHPITEKYLHFRSPLPEDMANLCYLLRSYSS